MRTVHEANQKPLAHENVITSILLNATPRLRFALKIQGETIVTQAHDGSDSDAHQELRFINSQTLSPESRPYDLEKIAIPVTN